ncbi:hypothetical protein STEG23_009923 [Scotinomys teguina]
MFMVPDHCPVQLPNDEVGPFHGVPDFLDILFYDLFGFDVFLDCRIYFLYWFCYVQILHCDITMWHYDDMRGYCYVTTLQDASLLSNERVRKVKHEPN